MVLGVAARQVSSRVQALLQPARPARTGHLVLAVVGSVLVLVLGVASLAHIHEALESAAPYLQR